MRMVVAAAVAVVRPGSSRVLVRREHCVIEVLVQEECRSFVGTWVVGEMMASSASIFGGQVWKGRYCDGDLEGLGPVGR